MGRGRPRKPIADHIRDGTFRRDRHGDRLAQPGAEPAAISPSPLPTPPDLSGVAADWFARLAAVLAGRLHASDSPMLAQAATWLSEEARCKSALASLEPSSLDYGRTIRAATSAAGAADRILSKFGLTPASRLRMPATPSPPGTLPEAKVHTRPKTPLDLAAEAWRAAGNTGRPSEEFIARFIANVKPAPAGKPKPAK